MEPKLLQNQHILLKALEIKKKIVEIKVWTPLDGHLSAIL